MATLSVRGLGVRIAWLHGGLTRKQKKETVKAIAEGEASIVIGTHALVQEGVEFASLALAVVDEQHRFGVGQRLSLRRKAEQTWPHQLMMSATPIPRPGAGRWPHGWCPPHAAVKCLPASGTLAPTGSRPTGCAR